MTVAELIEKLKAMPQDLIVTVRDERFLLRPAKDVEVFETEDEWSDALPENTEKVALVYWP